MTKFKVLATAAAALLGAVSANAATFTVTFPSTAAVPIPANDYNVELAALGLTRFAALGAGITLSSSAPVTFAFLGSESGFTDSFAAGSATYTQGPNANSFLTPFVFGTDNFLAGTFLAQFFGDGVTANVGHAGFGIFLPGNVSSTYTSNILYFGYDNQPDTGVDDDNHDDLIISASAGVPEASTWIMLIMGFGLIGLRSRQKVVAA